MDSCHIDLIYSLYPFTTVCDPATTCNNQGTCKTDHGSCECSDGFEGTDCNTPGKHINLITPTISYWNVFQNI